MGSELTASASRRYHTDLLAVRSAIKSAIETNNLLTIRKVYLTESKFDSFAEVWVEQPTLDLDEEQTTISLKEMRGWLESRGFRSGFFFPQKANAEVPDYLDPDHPRYSSKLAAAIHSWMAMDDEAKLKGKTPKQAIDKWLRENAAKYNLTNDEGLPINAAIEDCSKVANWNTSGGAPKTPG